MIASGGHTLSQKILAAKAGKTVVPGEIVDVVPDVAMSHDDTAAIARTLGEIGVDRVYDPDLHVVVLDHGSPAGAAAAATSHREIRAFVEQQGIENFYDVQAGICHQVLVEQGYALPGRLIVGSDAHTTSHGALGALATGIGRSEMADIMATGKISLRVPETVRITADGRLPAGVYPKDLILRIIGDVGPAGARYRAVEFAGPTIEAMPVSGRLTLCAMAVEMGGQNGYVEPDRRTLDYLNGRARDNFEIVTSDPDAVYSDERHYEASALAPQIACPQAVDSVVDVDAVAGTRIDQVVIGAFTNGRLDDLHVAAAVLAGRQVQAGVRLLILPASLEILKAATRDGTVARLLDAGAILLNPGCGPCLGYHEGTLAPGERALSSANGNALARLACRDVEIFLGSPASCAAAALTGRITDPREVVAPAALAAGQEA